MKHELEFNSFTVPNFVSAKMPVGLKQDEMRQNPQFAIHELSDEALEGLCKEFRNAVFEKKRLIKFSSNRVP